MRDILVSIIIFGSLPFILKRTYIGIIMWAWISYMNPHRLGWGFAYNFPFAYIVALVTLFSFLFNRDVKAYAFYGLTYIWFFFLFWMGLTTFFSIDSAGAMTQLIKVAKIQLFSILSLWLLNDFDRLRKFIWVVVLSFAYFGVKGGVFTLVNGGQFIVWGPPKSFIEGNNELALALLVIIPLMNFLRVDSKNKLVKKLLLVSMVLMGVSSLGSQSRGAFLAGGAMLLFFWSKSKNKLVTGFASLIFVVAVISFMPDSWHQRMDTMDTYEEDGSAMGRINAWYAAFYLAKDRFLGGGFDGINKSYVFQRYAPDPSDYHDAHSIYFEVLGDHGFIGLGVFLLMAISVWFMASRVIKDTEKIAELYNINVLAKMTQVSLIAFLTGGAFLGLAYFDLYYHLIVITLLCRYFTDQYLSSKQSNSVNLE